MPGRRPLDDVLVVGIEQAVAGPLATRHLADLGARVVKVESPRGGDFARDYDTAVRGLAAHFVWLNRGKQSLTLDFTTAAGSDALERLLARADVVVQNLAPGAAARRGLAAAQLLERFPRVIGVDISGYGSGGPLTHKRAYDLLVQAETGSCAITGAPGHPAKAGIPVADIGAAMYAYSSVLAALYDRGRSGVGAAIEVSLFDAASEWMGYAMNYTLGTGTAQEPLGLSAPSVAPYGAYPTRDGQTLVVGTTNDREWQRLALQVLARPDLAEDPSLTRNADRVRQRAVVDAAVAAWVITQDLESAQTILDKAAIGNGRLNGVQDLIEHPQHRARDRWREVETPAGPVPALVPPPTSDSWDIGMGPVPALGEHTDLVLRDLDYSPAEIAELRATGVV